VTFNFTASNLVIAVRLSSNFENVYTIAIAYTFIHVHSRLPTPCLPLRSYTVSIIQQLISYHRTNFIVVTTDLQGGAKKTGQFVSV